MSRRPAVLVARAVFGDIVDRLRVHFEVEDNPADRIRRHHVQAVTGDLLNPRMSRPSR